MTRASLQMVLLVPLALAAGCATSSDLIEDRLTGLDSLVAVEVGEVRFDYEQWTKTEEKNLEEARKHEAEWSRALRDAFLAEATGRGLGQGAERSRVDITVTDLNPGSRAARFWVGMGAGAGNVSATAKIDGHGEVSMRAKIIGGSWGGDFTATFEELGEAIAERIAERVAER